MNDISAILLLSIVSALVGFGFQRMMDPYMIFRFYHDWLEEISAKNLTLYYITKPFGRCIVCNTTWIGIVLSIIFFDPPLFPLYMIIVGVASAGIVVLIANIYEYLQNAL